MSICATSTSQANTSQSKLAQSLRGSLRNLTWKTSQTSELGRRVFHRKRLVSKEPPIREDWSEEFHLITREDIDLSPVAAALDITPSRTVPVEQKPLSAIPYKSLSPLIISDSLTNRVSTYTTRTITTSDSATPTYTEFAHITASFPQPPNFIPTPFSSPIETSASSSYLLGIRFNFALDYQQPSRVVAATITADRNTPSIASPSSDAHTGSFQRIKSRARVILRIPSLLSSWKHRA